MDIIKFMGFLDFSFRSLSCATNSRKKKMFSQINKNEKGDKIWYIRYSLGHVKQLMVDRYYIIAFVYARKRRKI